MEISELFNSKNVPSPHNPIRLIWLGKFSQHHSKRRCNVHISWVSSPPGCSGPVPRVPSTNCLVAILRMRIEGELWWTHMGESLEKAAPDTYLLPLMFSLANYDSSCASCFGIWCLCTWTNSLHDYFGLRCRGGYCEITLGRPKWKYNIKLSLMILLTDYLSLFLVAVVFIYVKNTLIVRS